MYAYTQHNNTRIEQTTLIDFRRTVLLTNWEWLLYSGNSVENSFKPSHPKRTQHHPYE